MVGFNTFLIAIDLLAKSIYILCPKEKQSPETFFFLVNSEKHLFVYLLTVLHI